MGKYLMIAVSKSDSSVVLVNTLPELTENPDDYDWYNDLLVLKVNEINSYEEFVNLYRLDLKLQAIQSTIQKLSNNGISLFVILMYLGSVFSSLLLSLQQDLNEASVNTPNFSNGIQSFSDLLNNLSLLMRNLSLSEKQITETLNTLNEELNALSNLFNEIDESLPQPVAIP